MRMCVRVWCVRVCVCVGRVCVECVCLCVGVSMYVFSVYGVFMFGRCRLC